jgi:predicted ATP-grasp superfamily ATP-dependent carboligase
MKQLDELLDQIFAYGVDWTEYKDKSEYDHDTSMFAAKIKAQQKEALKQAIQALIEEEKTKLLNELIEEAEEYEKWVGTSQANGHATTIKATPIDSIKRRIV